MMLFLILTLTWHSLGQEGLDHSKSYDQSESQYVVYENDTFFLKDVRQLADVLTNLTLDQFDGLQLNKRKKAFRRHIQWLTEMLEQAIFGQYEFTHVHFGYYLELNWFYQAYLLGCEMDNKPVKFAEKWSMLYHSWVKSNKLKYTFSDEGPLIGEHPKKEIWNEPILTKKRSPFDALAKKKKIKASSKMVIVFDDLSNGGSAPKIKAFDLDFDNNWMVKWGDEVHTDVVGSRIFAALGFDVDHPYFYGKDALFLVFDQLSEIKNPQDLIIALKKQYKFDLRPFISHTGIVSPMDTLIHQDLKGFVGLPYCTFIKCAIEARPDRVKRVGPFMAIDMVNDEAVRGALLAHAFIDNWDTRDRNTLLSTVHRGDHTYYASAVYSDLGTSFGVNLSPVFSDFKVGLVNEFDWEVAINKGKKIGLKYRLNHLNAPFSEATYLDLKWMAQQIAKLDSNILRSIVDQAGWPKPIGELYFHKLASRRASILKCFKITDAHEIVYDRNLTIYEDDILVIKDGRLVIDYKKDENPESFIGKKGRFRNYGN